MIRNIAACFLVLVWMLVIFMFSSSDGASSSATSGYLTNKVIEVFTGVTPSDKEYNEIKSNVSFIVRKVAHFTEYFILGLLLMNMMFILDIKSNRIIYSIMIVILYAISDELHQMLVDGRNGYIGDVLLDSSGGMFAIYLYHRLIMMRFNYEKGTN